ncbi:bile acid:sodium symporter family protein [Eubacterium aggregans]|uniref:bile acid:sodium symporter family protein n=1 Tax=Eubacterium aggregans TaxID=81409 RepID=UPI003F3F51DD
MAKIAKISSILTRYIGVIIIAFSIFTFFRPQAFSWTTHYTSVFLGIAMFGIGLTIKIQDFRVVWSHPREVAIGCVAQYTMMPALAWLLAWGFGLPADLAIVVILVGYCPGGTASNVITYIAGDDVALSVGMTILSTLLAPLLTPTLVYVLAGAWVQVSFLQMVQSVIQVILIPVLLGIAINRFWEEQLQSVITVLPVISVTAIVMIVGGIISVNAVKIVECGILVMGVVMLHNLLGMVIGLGIARLFRLEYDKVTAIAVEVGMQNSGLAVAMDTANFASNPLATLPGALFSVWHNLSGSVFARFRCRRREDTKIQHEAMI